MRKAIKWIGGVLVLAVIAYAGWQYMKPEQKPVYITEAVKRSRLSQTVSATGELSSSHLVEVGAQATGQIKKLYVKLGQQIKKGDLIAEIDSTSQRNELNTLKAKLETYQAQLASAKISLNSAEKKYKREKALWAENATSKEELEHAQDALAESKAKITELQSTIKQTQISINTAEADLGYTRIIAPMDGTVVALPVEEGQTINAAQSSPTIIQLADLGTMLNKMQIGEGDITKVKSGQKIQFTILSEPDSPIEATLESIDPALTTMSNSTGNTSISADNSSSAIYYYARALVPNPEGKLSIGMTTQNTVFVTSRENVLIVPALTVKRREGKSYVQVLDAEGYAHEKEIQTGLKNSSSVEVISGLKEGDKVVVSEASGDEWRNDERSRRGEPL
ncbi:efflux RND transporter periplasmic adaptor subunit [Neisseria wadsworthii]|uniref:Macrolide-specific efflux protein MacA n=1 Tax=Neisseria wadsworthii 9715 TaxID=1030841 RepID=G4CPW8_9NEIS|nr:efflux RND transporter periplasmic adaptor subunit [Neisseria wadsworthii]EGZ47283.1 macrolide-specific efflux protein MacA [Neisseria wadsworthii 9715]QMT34906.1 efflux RND transporter periplasmic adaptor subunit [Neisseria wadsworthii]